METLGKYIICSTVDLTELFFDLELFDCEDELVKLKEFFGCDDELVELKVGFTGHGLLF